VLACRPIIWPNVEPIFIDRGQQVHTYDARLFSKKNKSFFSKKTHVYFCIVMSSCQVGGMFVLHDQRRCEYFHRSMHVVVHTTASCSMRVYRNICPLVDFISRFLVIYEGSSNNWLLRRCLNLGLKFSSSLLVTF